MATVVVGVAEDVKAAVRHAGVALVRDARVLARGGGGGADVAADAHHVLSADTDGLGLKGGALRLDFALEAGRVLDDARADVVHERLALREGWW